MRVGDFVRHKVTDTAAAASASGDKKAKPKTKERKAQIVGKGSADNTWNIVYLTKEKGEKDYVALTDVAEKALVKEGFMARTSASYTNMIGELAGNALFYGIIQKIRSNPTFGKRFMTFCFSDIAYELLGRDLVDSIIPFMRPESFSNVAGVKGSDFVDAFKAIPVVILQQILCKVFYKTSLFGHLFKNLFDAYTSYALSNMATRNVSSYFDDKDSQFMYRY